jgi:nitrogen fixation NifU-like protein
MTEAIQGKSQGEIEVLYESFHELMTGDPSVAAEADSELGKLRVFEGVREFPVRVKCATLAWHTLMAALADKGASISTE